MVMSGSEVGTVSRANSFRILTPHHHETPPGVAIS
jgi:hypothetical protein